MTQYSVVQASIGHIKPMAAQMRTAACVTLQGFGFRPREALRRAYVSSRYCRTAVIDGRPVAMWGITGPLLSDGAYVWLVLSDRIASMPVAVVREARAELARFMTNYRELAITVLPDDEAAIRFALYLGFHDREEPDGSLLPRKALLREIMTNPKHRIPVGDSYVIALGYHALEIH